MILLTFAYPQLRPINSDTDFQLEAPPPPLAFTLQEASFPVLSKPKSRVKALCTSSCRCPPFELVSLSQSAPEVKQVFLQEFVFPHVL